MEMATGIGLTLAPVLGSFLYTLGGFRLPFICFGVMFLGFSIFIKCIIPPTVDRTESNEE